MGQLFHNRGGVGVRGLTAVESEVVGRGGDPLNVRIVRFVHRAASTNSGSDRAEALSNKQLLLTPKK
jgi:hypothetical protein